VPLGASLKFAWKIWFQRRSRNQSHLLFRPDRPRPSSPTGLAKMYAIMQCDIFAAEKHAIFRPGKTSAKKSTFSLFWASPDVKSWGICHFCQNTQFLGFLSVYMDVLLLPVENWSAARPRPVPLAVEFSPFRACQANAIRISYTKFVFSEYCFVWHFRRVVALSFYSVRSRLSHSILRIRTD
jgi:hypothetical protein